MPRVLVRLENGIPVLATTDVEGLEVVVYEDNDDDNFNGPGAVNVQIKPDTDFEKDWSALSKIANL